ncbi:phenylalanine--tRNA ligase beta subunit [Anaplasma platys]|uniref:Phenylalanine--tRNA ligase beta subunit n=1 Tax=Anaplasma platys TaxID=949 RepID=A0A858PXP3_9RICK|nr:phenylalanine--tRNA ligase subunit beta [Anaplasma platys]QJC27373.1 phenylalanine--tRNA ligase beta subunit [Anaplasma platys]
MKFTYSWLLDYLDTDWVAPNVVDKLSAIGIEAALIDCGTGFNGLVVAEVLEVGRHPDASKLSICKVSNGSEHLQVVCGAPNVRVGMLTVLACIGSRVPISGMLVQKVLLRGVESFGMLCSLDELGVGAEGEGIADLSPEQYKVGERFFPADPIIEVSVTPNRGDCLGIYAIARELAAAGVGKLKDFPHYAVCESFVPSPMALEVRSGSVFTGRCIKSVDNTKHAPRWMRDRLMAAGVHSISCVVDIINYVMLVLNRPMHVYDLDKIRGDGLVVEQATEGSRFIALNRKEYDLSAGDLIVRDLEGTVLCLAGIMGSEHTGCSRGTKNIFLESAWYDPVDIALSSRRLKLSTDASYRFSRYVDPRSIERGLDYVTHLIVECCGGEVYAPVMAGNKSQGVSQVDFDPGDVGKVCNVHMESAQMLGILERLGFSVSVKSEKFWKVCIPTWRSDICRSQDLVEEVVRIYGYDEIQEQEFDTKSASLTIEGGPSFDDSFANRLRALMISSGLTEVVTWSFLSGSVVEKLGFSVDHLYIDNPISSQFDVMRPTVLTNLLQVVANNQACGAETVAIFELGDIYLDLNISEPVICGVRSGGNIARNPHEPVRKFDFFDVKFDVECVFSQYGIEAGHLEFREETSKNYLHPARSACIYHEGVLCGYVGELHPDFLEFFELKNSVACFEVFLSRITPVNRQDNRIFVVNRYQPVRRDFAFILDGNVKSGSLVTVIKAVDFVEDVAIFDVYKGENIAAGKVSMAVAVLITSMVATMTEVEIKKVTDSIISVVEKELGGQLRLETN